MKLLTVEPQDLRFTFELKKQIPCTTVLRNESDHFVGFKVKTTSPKKYTVRPNIGVLPPHATLDVVVTMQAQNEVPSDMLRKDKFLIQSIVASEGMTGNDLTTDKFDKTLGHSVEETKLGTLYHFPEKIVEESSPVISVDGHVVEDPTPMIPVDDHVETLKRTYKAVSKEVDEKLESLKRLNELLGATVADPEPGQPDHFRLLVVLETGHSMLH